MSREKTKITVETMVRGTPEKVWELFNEPKHIVEWATAGDDWHTVKAENDVRAGGTFFYRMEAKDGSKGFDLVSVYDEVTPLKSFAYSMADGRKVWATFTEENGNVHIVETFEAENQNPIDMQRGGWQAILDNFKKYAEAQ